MMISHVNSTKRYSELHGLYTEAAHLRDRYKLSVQVQRPVMTSHDEYEEMRKNFLQAPLPSSSEEMDLSLVSDHELERYRNWLKSKNNFTGSSKDPQIY